MSDQEGIIASLVNDFEQYARSSIEQAIATITAPPTYVTHFGVNAASVPSPRLQLRWGHQDADSCGEWVCHYELVFPLRENDIRTENCEGGSAVIELGRTRISGGGDPPWLRPGSFYMRTPYRDGNHAMWDGELLGLPIFILHPDGTSERLEQTPIDAA